MFSGSMADMVICGVYEAEVNCAFLAYLFHCSPPEHFVYDQAGGRPPHSPVHYSETMRTPAVHLFIARLSLLGPLTHQQHGPMLAAPTCLKVHGKSLLTPHPRQEDLGPGPAWYPRSSCHDRRTFPLGHAHRRLTIMSSTGVICS